MKIIHISVLKYQFILCVTLFFITAGCVSNQENPKIQNQQPFILTEDGAWCWFSDPRAIYHAGEFNRTYTGWVDANGSIMIGYYDHDLDSIVTNTLDLELQVDDHNNPSLIMDSEARLMVFYSKHSSKSPMKMARALYPESIDEFETQELTLNDSSIFENASNTYTYTNIVHLEDENRMFLFWRGTDFKPNFSTSSNDGHSWETGKILILPERIYSNRRPYLKVGSNQKDKIHFAFTDGHPRNEPNNSIYYAQYRDQKVYKADGTLIKSWAELPLDPSECDLVYDASATGEKSWIWDVAGDAQDNPALVYSRFPNDSTHIYYYATWTNGAWKNTKLTESGKWFPQTPVGETEREPNYSGGITLDHKNPSILYMSLEKDGIFEIEKWETVDFGETWAKTAITKESRFSNIRPFVVRNYPDDYTTMVLWMNFSKYLHYTDYNSSIRLVTH